MPSATETLAPAPHNFVQSLNALLKFARLYGLGHSRSDVQFEDTWKHLKAAIDARGPAGLTLGTSAADLVLDGDILESTAAGQSLAQILTHARIGSVTFAGELSEDSFLDFVKTFARGALKPSEQLRLLKTSFSENFERGIRINEVRFVPTAAREMPNYPNSQNWLRDPAKLAEAIGMGNETRPSRRFSSFEFGQEFLGDLSGREPFHQPVTEHQTGELLQLVGAMATASNGSGNDGSAWKEKFDLLDDNAKSVFRDALAGLTSKFRLAHLDDSALIRLSNDIAIRCATERFESGQINPRAVRPLLSKLSSEIAALKAGLNSHDEKSVRNQTHAKPQTDALERQFWASLHDSSRRGVLLSSDCWCVPARNVQQCVKEHQRNGDIATAEKLLLQYASCVGHDDAEARKHAANGLTQIADTYTSVGGAPLNEAVRAIGEQLHRERDAELQTLLSAAFVKFSQKAAEGRAFPAMQRALHTLASLEKSRPSWTQSLRPRIGINHRIPEFIDDGLRAAELPNDLIEVLRSAPAFAAEQLADRLMRVSRASEREKVVSMARSIGEPVQVHLRQTLELAPTGPAIRVSGLLSRLNPVAVEELLPRRIAASQRAAHDEALRQLSIASAPERGRMLMRMIDRMDAMIVPMALDEIGMSGDASLAPELLRLAHGNLLPDSSDFVRVKAIEALGRLRAPETEADLLGFVEARKTWRWAYPAEMRLAAAQALTKLDPERATTLLSNAGLDTQLLAHAPLDAKVDRDFVRFRRYQRIRMTRPTSAVVESSRGKYQPSVQVLSLEGGLLSGDLQLSVGTAANLRISAGMRPIRLDVLVRFTKANQAGVEMVGMELEDRSRLRSLLVSMAGATVVRKTLPVSA